MKFSSSVKPVRLIAAISAVPFLALFTVALFAYPGSKVIYGVFSAVYFAVLASGFLGSPCYGYLILAVLAWLGFWLKLSVHLWLGYPYSEPIGYFDFAPQSWDAVLTVSAVAAMALLLGRCVFGLHARFSTRTLGSVSPRILGLYARARIVLWTALLGGALVLALLNLWLGIYQIGLVPKVYPWPVNAVTYLVMSAGVAMCVSTLLYWDVLLGRKVLAGAWAIIIEGFLISVSFLSRGMFPFRVVPASIALWDVRTYVRGLSLSHITTLVLTAIAAFVVSLAMVTVLREVLYTSGMKTTDAHRRSDETGARKSESAKSEPESSEPGSSPSYPVRDAIMGRSEADDSRTLDTTLTELSRLLVDRWIGLEGVMAVQGYPDKNLALQWYALKERRETGKIPLHEAMFNSPYLTTDPSRYVFGSLPGGVAFFYYSGSLWIVAAGMFTLCVLVISSEFLVHRWTGNPFLCALYGGITANHVAQFGVGPFQVGRYLLTLLCIVAVIALVQRHGVGGKHVFASQRRQRRTGMNGAGVAPPTK